MIEFSRCYFHNHYCQDEGNGKNILEEEKKVMSLKDSGFKVYHTWQCEAKNCSVKIDETVTKAYPHIIVFEFKSMLPDFGDDRN